MTEALGIWLALTLSFAMLALLAVWARRETATRAWALVMFIIMAPISFFALQQPLGHPDYDTVPPGEWTVLGARIDVDVAIYAMLDNGTGEPHLYRLPYSAGQADKLQQAIDATAGGQAAGVEGKADNEGEMEFHPKPQPPSPDKIPEAPVVGEF